MYICEPRDVVNYPIVSHVFPYRQWNRFIMTTHTETDTRFCHTFLRQLKPKTWSKVTKTLVCWLIIHVDL